MADRRALRQGTTLPHPGQGQPGRQVGRLVRRLCDDVAEPWRERCSPVRWWIKRRYMACWARSTAWACPFCWWHRPAALAPRKSCPGTGSVTNAQPITAPTGNCRSASGRGPVGQTMRCSHTGRMKGSKMRKATEQAKQVDSYRFLDHQTKRLVQTWIGLEPAGIPREPGISRGHHCPDRWRRAPWR